MPDHHQSGLGGRGALCVVALAMALCGVHAETPDSDLPPAKQSEQWFESVGPGETLRVVNRFGNVYARFGGYEPQTEILATIQKLDPDRPALEVVRERVESGLVVRVGYADPASSGSLVTMPTAGSPDQVDLVLFVPKGATLDVETTDGLIAIKKIRSDLFASSIDGEIRIQSIEGRIKVKSDRGPISATIEVGVTDQPQEITTVTGDIEVHLWEDAGMDVRVATSGEISTDFTMEIEHRRFEEPGKHAKATVGKGGPRLDLRSKRGRVRLLRLPRHFKPEE